MMYVDMRRVMIDVDMSIMIYTVCSRRVGIVMRRVMIYVDMRRVVVYVDPPAPMNHVKKIKGWPLQDAPAKLVQLWYKTFPPGRFLPGGNEEANSVE